MIETNFKVPLTLFAKLLDYESTMHPEVSIPKQMNPLILKYEYTILDVTLKRMKVDENQNVLLMPFHRVKKKS